MPKERIKGKNPGNPKRMYELMQSEMSRIRRTIYTMTTMLQRKITAKDLRILFSAMIREDPKNQR